jgi:acetylornithine/succinyldiaminopimelate/putrescine aminotransferase
MQRLPIVQWAGSKAIDENGKEYIDLTSGGIFAAILGPNNKELIEAVSSVADFCSYAPRFNNYYRDQYLEELTEFTGYESAALFTAGCEATEAFWRAARHFTGKPAIWGGLVDPDLAGSTDPPPDAMHGMTLGAQIMAGRMQSTAGEGSGRFAKPHHMTCGGIMEPYHAPSAKFHNPSTIEHIKAWQKEFPDIFLCIDEIQGGFGRTGELFAHLHYKDLKPDCVTIGKACGGGWPLSALLGPKALIEDQYEAAHLHSTHSGNPAMCAVGSTVIRLIREHNLINESRRKGEKMHELLKQFPVPVYGAGLLAGLKMPSATCASQVATASVQRGVLVIPTGREWVKLGPALTIPEHTLIGAVKILQEVVEELVAEFDVKGPEYEKW